MVRFWWVVFFMPCQARVAKLLVVLALTTVTLHAQRITRLRADVDLRKDGSARVSEKVTVQGSSFLQRSIPLHLKSGPNSWDRKITLISVQDSSGRALAHQAVVREGQLVITVPLSSSSSEPSTVQLTYEVRHSVVVYWEVHSASFTLIFADNHHWHVPFEQVLVTATVPDDPRGGFQAYLNGSGDTPGATVDGRRARVWRDNVPAGYWIELTLSFPSGMVSLPAREWLDQEPVRELLAVLFIGALCAAYFLYRRSVAAETLPVPDYSNVVIPPPRVEETTGGRSSFVESEVGKKEEGPGRP
jgi:predicted membrane protein DUF2207